YPGVHPGRAHGQRDRHQPQGVPEQQPADSGENGVSQKLIMWPTRPWKHSCIASDRVGCVWTLRASSCAVRSHFCARVSSGSSSETTWPTMWRPSSSPYLASAINLTKPLGAPMPCALPFAVNGNLATLTS